MHRDVVERAGTEGRQVYANLSVLEHLSAFTRPDARAPDMFRMDQYVDAAMVHMSSWFDAYPRTATDNYIGLSKRKRGPIRLIMGPWTHGDRQLTCARPEQVAGRAGAVLRVLRVERLVEERREAARERVRRKARREVEPRPGRRPRRLRALRFRGEIQVGLGRFPLPGNHLLRDAVADPVQRLRLRRRPRESL